MAVIGSSQDESEIYGLLVLDNNPKNSNLNQDCDDWEDWINDEYDVNINVKSCF